MSISAEAIIANQYNFNSNTPAAEVESRVTSVSEAFAYQYYRMVSTNPIETHRFYLPGSQITHVTLNDGMTRKATELNEQKDLLEFRSRDVTKVILTSINGQPACDGACFVHLTGELEGCEAVRKFSHCVFLTPQENRTNCFYVQNDIFVVEDDANNKAKESNPAYVSMMNVVPGTAHNIMEQSQVLLHQPVAHPINSVSHLGVISQTQQHHGPHPMPMAHPMALTHPIPHPMAHPMAHMPPHVGQFHPGQYSGSYHGNHYPGSRPGNYHPPSPDEPHSASHPGSISHQPHHSSSQPHSPQSHSTQSNSMSDESFHKKQIPRQVTNRTKQLKAPQPIPKKQQLPMQNHPFQHIQVQQQQISIQNEEQHIIQRHVTQEQLESTVIQPQKPPMQPQQPHIPPQQTHIQPQQPHIQQQQPHIQPKQPPIQPQQTPIAKQSQQPPIQHRESQSQHPTSIKRGSAPNLQQHQIPAINQPPANYNTSARPVHQPLPQKIEKNEQESGDRNMAQKEEIVERIEKFQTVEKIDIRVGELIYKLNEVDFPELPRPEPSQESVFMERGAERKGPEQVMEVANKEGSEMQQRKQVDSPVTSVKGKDQMSKYPADTFAAKALKIPSHGRTGFAVQQRSTPQAVAPVVTDEKEKTALVSQIPLTVSESDISNAIGKQLKGGIIEGRAVKVSRNSENGVVTIVCDSPAVVDIMISKGLYIDGMRYSVERPFQFNSRGRGGRRGGYDGRNDTYNQRNGYNNNNHRFNTYNNPQRNENFPRGGGHDRNDQRYGRENSGGYREANTGGYVSPNARRPYRGGRGGNMGYRNQQGNQGGRGAYMENRGDEGNRKGNEVSSHVRRGAYMGNKNDKGNNNGNEEAGRRNGRTRGGNERESSPVSAQA